jgi:hypothetical protein
MFWSEPSIDELIRVVGPTEFDRNVICFLGFVYLILLVHCIESWKSRPKWLDDLVVASVHLLMIGIPCMFVKKIDITINTKSPCQLLYWGLRLLSLYFNKTRLCKYMGIQPQISMNTICTMKDLIPDKKNTELWDRLSELVPLNLPIAGFVACHHFLYDYVAFIAKYGDYILLSLNLCFIASDCIHFHQKAKKTA